MKQPNLDSTLAFVATAVLAITATSPAFAESSDAPRERRGPPTVAIDACNGAAAGDACSFVGRRDDTLAGFCESRREVLVCVPEGHRERPGERGGIGDETERD